MHMCNPDLNIDSHVWMVGGRKRSWQQVVISVYLCICIDKDYTVDTNECKEDKNTKR